MRKHEAPFGWSFGEAKKLVPNPREQVVVRRVHVLRAKGVTLRDIARDLSEHKATSRAGTPLTFKQVDKMLHREPARGIFRQVRPLDKFVSINLDAALRGFYGERLSTEDREGLERWIWSYAVSLRVIAPEKLIDDEARALVQSEKFYRQFEGASVQHKQLCALGAQHLRAIGKEPQAEGNYAGGRCDVSAVDGSFFIECGTLRPAKVVDAMRGGQTLLVMPYPSGYKGEHFYSGDLSNADGVQLGLVFTPQRPEKIERVDPFVDNATSGLFVERARGSREEEITSPTALLDALSAGGDD